MEANPSSVDIQICNLALFRMGGKKITGFSDATPEERDCKTLYALTRDEVLESFPWSFAKKRAALVESTSSPAFGYSYSFALPADCLRPMSINSDSVTKEPDWTREGGELLTDEEEVNLKYIGCADSGKFTPSFKRAVSLLLASRLAMSIAKNAKLSDSLENKYIQYMEQDAMVINARSSNETPYEASDFVDARN